MGRASRPRSAARPVWKITVPVSTESEDAVSELLFQVAGQHPSVYQDFETHQSVARLYLSARPAKKELQQLAVALQTIRRSGLHLPAGAIRVERLRSQDWAESWKRHFKSINIEGRLIVRPSWLKGRVPKRCAVVELDPGLSFGTGQHPTTRFCLQQLVALGREQGPLRSFLDLGAGSGILAIAAARLGYAPVHALEIDPDAVRIARNNARHNRVEKKVLLMRHDVARFRPRRQFDVICANLIFDLLIASRDSFRRWLKPDGVLVLAGILKTQFPRVVRTFAAGGFKLLTRSAEGEWESGAFSLTRA
jgi:ribosomal protein L11 methyltransferase